MLRRISDMENTSGLKYEMDYPDIKGFNVFDRDGNDVGEIQDLLVDTDTGMVNHAIVGRGWISSILGERQVIIPFNRMRVMPTEKRVTLDIVRDDLSQFPEWTNVDQPGLMDRLSDWWNTRKAA